MCELDEQHEVNNVQSEEDDFNDAQYSLHTFESFFDSILHLDSKWDCHNVSAEHESIEHIFAQTFERNISEFQCNFVFVFEHCFREKVCNRSK